MRVLAVSQQGADISFAPDELILINNALNEVCNGVEIASSEFQTRLGVERDFAQALLDRIKALIP